MQLSEYSDDEIIEEIKHRGIRIEVWDCQLGQPAYDIKVLIGGEEFYPNSNKNNVDTRRPTPDNWDLNYD